LRISILDQLSAIDIDIIKFDQNLDDVFANFDIEEFLERVKRTEKMSMKNKTRLCNEEFKIQREIFWYGLLDYVQGAKDSEGTSGSPRLSASQSVTPVNNKINHVVKTMIYQKMTRL